MNNTITTKKQAVKNFVNQSTGLNLAVNSKSVEAFYYNILTDNASPYDCYIRPCYTTGKGRYTSAIIDVSKEITDVLNLMSIPYELGNDAPKGGKLGNYILITAAERIAVTEKFNQFQTI
jgi:hypothetical protein